jgi:hypothetical protein
MWTVPELKMLHGISIFKQTFVLKKQVTISENKYVILLGENCFNTNILMLGCPFFLFSFDFKLPIREKQILRKDNESLLYVIRLLLIAKWNCAALITTVLSYHNCIKLKVEKYFGFLALLGINFQNID